MGKHRKEPDFGTKCPEVAGSVPTPEHAAIVGAPAKPHGFVGSVPTPEYAAGMGQETFSGRTATESKMEGTHER